jgi:hypothetical protein
MAIKQTVRRREQTMGDKKASDSSFDTCFENMSFAQMRGMMGQKGVGTLCKEIMGTMVQTKKGESACLQFMRKMLTEQGKTDEEREKNKEQSSRDSKEDRRRG